MVYKVKSLSVICIELPPIPYMSDELTIGRCYTALSEENGFYMLEENDIGHDYTCYPTSLFVVVCSNNADNTR